MDDFWRAFGHGFIKLLVCLFASFGIGLLVFAIAVKGEKRAASVAVRSGSTGYEKRHCTTR